MKNTINCPKCKGTGEIENPFYIGQKFKAERIKRDVGLRELARRMGYSPAYISELEHGKKAWSKHLKDRFMKEL